VSVILNYSTKYSKLIKIGGGHLGQFPCKWNNVPWLVPSLQRRWFRCWRPFAWKKAKNLRRRRIGGIARWGSVPNARRACFSIRSYPPSHFQAIACVGNDSKARNLGSLWFEVKGYWASFFRQWTTAPAAKKEGFSSSHRDRWWKMDSLQQSKEKKVIGTARSRFYVVGSAKYSRCKGYAVYLVGSGRCCLLWAVETETITGERSRPQLMRLSRALREKRPQYEQRHEKVILQHDNARPHVAKPVKTYLETLKWEVLPHPPYSPDIAPSDYYLFRSMAHGLADQQFRSYEDIKNGLIRG